MEKRRRRRNGWQGDGAGGKVDFIRMHLGDEGRYENSYLVIV